MYLISLYFDNHTHSTIQNHINKLSSLTNNTFMKDHNVPPHLTLLAFDTKYIHEVIPILDNYFKSMSCFDIQYMSAGMFPGVIYLSAILNYNLHNHLTSLYEKLKDVDCTSFNPKYLPFQYMPHTTIAKTLDENQMLIASQYIASNFFKIKGKVLKIALSKTNPYEDLIVYNLKEHQ